MATTETVVENAISEPKTPAICEHIKDNGLRCGSPALRGRHFCYFHSRAHHPTGRFGHRNYRAPVADTVEALQIATTHLVQALATGDIPIQQANSVRAALNLAKNLLRMKSCYTDRERASMVTEISQAMEEVLEPEPEQQPNENQQIPPHLTKATEIVMREIEQLRHKVQTPQQLREYEDHARTLKGTSDPRFYIALDRISHHDYAVKRLHELGIV